MGEPNAQAAMFSQIAPRYDLLNHLLSGHMDRLWRRRLVRKSELRPGERVLDLCTGSGDVALGFARACPGARVVGLDSSRGMLAMAADKVAARRAAGTVRLVLGDAYALPLADDSCHVVSVAFGLRNLADHLAGLREMRRVLRPGGRLLVLELARPGPGMVGVAHGLYLKTVVPLLGGLLSGSWAAYRYLAESVAGFLPPESVTSLLAEAGFGDARAERIGAGAACLYWASSR